MGHLPRRTTPTDPPVVAQFDTRAFPRGLKPCQFTALIGAAEAAPFKSKCKLYLYRFSLRVDRMFRRSVDLSVGARTGWRGVGTSDERQNK